MKFELGKFYQHEAGRCIYVAGKVNTFRWGDMFVVEETDRTGHSISTVEVENAEDTHGAWTEIGKEEFMRHFKARINHVPVDKKAN